MAKDDGLLADAQNAFKDCEEHEFENRQAALDDMRFAKLGEQWPESIRQQRIKDGRPCLTINRQPAFIRQVVNEARQQRPSIKVHPADSNADPVTADIYNGLIRNIEQTSKADVAYDTAVDCAVSSGFGYFRIATDYACDDSFDLDLRIERIANQFSVYGDPLSTAADSSDWNQAFVTELIGWDAFQAKYPGAQKTNWESSAYVRLDTPWIQDKSVLTAEWWRREKIMRTILAMSDGSVVEESVYKTQKDIFDAQGMTVLGSRQAPSHKVTQTILTGAEVLERNDWAGKYIPIVPVYGDEVNIEGKRYLRSLIRDAKDPQRMLNYWRTASTELVALAPRVPFIGRKGTFKTDAKKWATVNSQNHAFVEYDGDQPPQRQPLDSGRAVGAIQEAANASDDMKAILGMYDPSLGMAADEQSGKAILAQQNQGHTSNYHFLDNLSRAIEHGGRILIDLIPTVYSGQRMIRVLGYDNKASNIQLGGPMPVKQQDGTFQQPQADPAMQLPISHICDLSRGKYDLTVETGPSYATRREENNAVLTQLIDAYPPAAPILGDLIVKNMDFPDSEEVARRLHALLPPQLLAAENGQPANPLAHPAVQQMMQQGQQVIQEQSQKLQEAGQQVQDLTFRLQQAELNLQIQKANTEIKSREAFIKGFQAQTDRIKALQQPEQVAAE